MAQAKKGKMNYRCPSCFMRDLDIDMFYDAQKEEYYCLRCCYKGTEKDVIAKNDMARFRYRNLLDRIECFD
jgi:Zn ribbon nucleic-acid-binding protein